MTPDPVLDWLASFAAPDNGDTISESCTTVSSPFVRSPPEDTNPVHIQPDSVDVAHIQDRLAEFSLTDTPPYTPITSGFRRIARMRDRAIVFSGRGRESAEDYLDSVRAAAIGSGAQDASEKETVKRATFREGLRGEALEWYHSEIDKDTKRNWTKLEEKFVDRFPESSDNSLQFALTREVVDFARKDGEPLVEFLKRGEKLHRKISDVKLRNMLTSTLVARMPDGEVDLALKTRVEDILFTQGKLLPGRTGVKEDCTFDHVLTLIKDCLSSYGKRLDHDELYADEDGDRDQDSISMRALETIAKSMEKMGNHMASLSVRPQPAQQMDPNSYQRSRPNSGAPRGLMCFNCGERGHGAWECPQPRDPEAIARRRNMFENNQAQNASRNQGNASAVVNQGELTQEAFSSLCNEIRDRDRHHLSQSPIISQPQIVPMAAALKDGKVAKPQPKKVLTRSPKGKQVAGREPQKTVRFDELPGRDEPGDLSEPSFPEIVVGGGDPGQDSRPSPTRPSSSRSDPDVEISQGPNIDAQSSLRDVVGKYDISEIRKFLRTVESERRKTEPPQPRSRPLIRGMSDHNVQPFDVGSELAKMNLNVNFMALLQAAPSIRADLNRLMGPAAKNNRGQPHPVTPAQANPHAGENVVAFVDTALTPDEIPLVRVSFVDALVDGVATNRAMLDNGSTMDLISPQFAKQIGAKPRQLAAPLVVKLANDRASQVAQYVLVEVEVGGIFCCLMAYVLGDGHTFDILLSQSWYYRVRAIQDWGRGVITIYGRAGNGTDVNLNTGVGSPLHCEPLLNEHPDVHGDLRPEEEEELIRELSDVLEYLDESEHQGGVGNG